MIDDILGPQIIGPPAESPIAERFEHALLLHLATNCTLEREYVCPTPWAKFRIDIVVSNGLHRIGIECDGKEFHDRFSDETRDSMILGLGLVDTIWRFRGADINFAIHDCLYLMSQIDSDLFTERGRKVLWTQACDSVKQFKEKHPTYIFMGRLNHREGEEKLLPHNVEIVRNSRMHLNDGYEPFWVTIYREVESHTHLTFEQVVKQQREKARNAW